MSRYVLWSSMLLLLLAGMPLFAEPAADLYMQALEELARGEETEALTHLQEVVTTYPDSPYAARAQEFVDQLTGKLDHSAVFLFYGGQLITSAVSTLSIAASIWPEPDPLGSGLLGIISLSAGGLSAWYLSKDINMGWGQALWIEFIDNSLLVNSLLLSDILDLNERAANAVIGSSKLIGRALGYGLVWNQLPSVGRVNMVLQGYAWAQFYTVAFVANFIDPDGESKITQWSSLVIPDLASVGAFFLWDALHWSFERISLVTVAGIGGGLLGFFGDMILDAFWELEEGQADAKRLFGMIMSFALLGQGVGVWLTRDMPEEPAQTASSMTGTPKPLSLTWSIPL